jgi:hypothetical protein
METLIYNGEKSLELNVNYQFGIFCFTALERVRKSEYRYSLVNAETGKERQYTGDIHNVRRRIGYLSSASRARVIEEPATIVEIIEEPTKQAIQQPAQVTPQPQAAQSVDVAQALTALQAVFGGGKDTELRATVESLAARLAALESQPARKIEITQGGQVTRTITGVQHEKFETILRLVSAPFEARCSPYLYGPSGTGKTYTAGKIAEALGLNFYCISAVQDILNLEGYQDAAGIYHGTAFRTAFEDGGLLLFDEIDASLPDVINKLNAALANGIYEFPDKVVTVHPDFRFMAAGNTCGKGGNQRYTGRYVLEESTLNRFAITAFNYSPAIEESLGSPEIVGIVRGLRAACNDLQLTFDYGYRDISRLDYLTASGLPLADVIDAAIVRGHSEDEMRNIVNCIPAEFRKGEIYKELVRMYVRG